MNITAVKQVAPSRYHFTVVAAETELAQAAAQAYERTKGNFIMAGYEGQIPPREAIEEKHGNIFYCDGFNDLLSAQAFDLLRAVCDAEGLQPLGMPEPHLNAIEGASCSATLTVATMPKVVLSNYREQPRLAEIIQSSHIENIDPLLEEEVYQLMKERLDDKLRALSLTMADYLEKAQTTAEAIEAELRASAAQTLRSKIVLLAIAMQEQISVSPEEISAFIAVDAPTRRLSIADYRMLIPAYQIEWELLAAKAMRLLSQKN